MFVREYVPQRTVAALARWTYNEPYAATRMASRASRDGPTLTVEHRLDVAGRERRIGVTADAAAPFRPADDSPEAFLIEHQWGFGTSRRGRLVRYQVVHEPWDVCPVRSLDLDWDWAAAYGPAFAPLQGAEPVSVVLAAGSTVSVYPRGQVRGRPPVPAGRGRPAVARRGDRPMTKPPARRPTVGRSTCPSRPTRSCCSTASATCATRPSASSSSTTAASGSGSRRSSRRWRPTCSASTACRTILDTVVMIDGDHAFTHSTAVLRIAAELDSPWPLAALAALIPKPLRDDAYAFVAKHRTQWFGRRPTCRVATDAERARFLDA